MAVKFSNNGKTTLASNITSSATSISVTDGSVFPTLGSGDYFYLTFENSSSGVEIVKVTDLTGNTLTVERAQENTTASAYASGDRAELRLTVGGITDSSGTSRFYAKAGEAISKGQAVYISGNVSSVPVISLANASDANKMPAFGLADSDLANNEFGYVVSYGELSGIDTATSLNLHDTLYVSATTAGAITNTAPSGEGNLIQNMGVVVRENSNNGSVKVGGAGRSNAAPNLNDGNIFIGNSSNKAVTASLGTEISSYLSSNDISTGNITVSGTVDGRDVAADGTKLDGIASGAEVNVNADWNATSGDAQILNKPTIPTNNNQLTNGAGYATESYVNTSVSNLVDSAPSTLDTLNELAAALGDDANFSTTVTNSIATKLPLAGGTLTGNLSFGDNDKAIFGDGSDLQIYHDGSNSYIRDIGTGNLNILADELKIMNAAGTENKAFFVSDGGSYLYHNNSAKLETTATGIDVAGTVEADAMTVNGNTVWNAGNDGSGSGLDADTVDGLQGSSFLRSDAFDVSSSGLYLQGGSYNAGTDTTTAPLIIDEGDHIYTKDGGYLRKLIGKTTGDTIEVGQSGTGLIGQINFLPGTAGNSAVKINGNTVWNAGNDGAGSGLDADTLDGYQLDGSTSIATRVFNNKGQTHGTVNNFNAAMTPGPNYIQGSTNGPESSGQWYGFMLGLGSEYGTTTGSSNNYAAQMYFKRNASSNANYLHMRSLENGSWGSWLKVSAGYADSAGSAGNADTVDGIQASQFLRSDVADVYAGRVLEFGNAGNGSNTSGAFLTIEGNTDSTGEGSGRLFFREHNSTTASADNFGMSLGYRGGATSVTTAMGNSWTGLTAIGNGEWGMWGHDNNATGSLIAHGPRSGAYTDFTGLKVGGNYVWHAGNDGDGSGLDADTVDGVHAYRIPYALNGNFGSTNTDTAGGGIGSNSITRSMFYRDNGSNFGTIGFHAQHSSSGDYAWQMASTNYTDASSIQARVKNNGTWTSPVTIWNSGNDGTGSGLDADLLDGLDSTAFARVDQTAAIKSFNSTLTINSYTRIARITGNSLSTAVRAYFSGTASNIVVNAFADILVNHTGDIQISSNSSDYTTLTLKVEANGDNEDYDLYAKHTAGTTTLTLITTIHSIGLETITPNPTATAYSGGTSAEHAMIQGGLRYSQSSSNVDIYSDGDYYSGSSKVWHAGNDGSGSGLDADTVDGLHASSFEPASATIIHQGSDITSQDWNTFIDGTEASWNTAVNASGSNRPPAYPYGQSLSISKSAQAKFQLYASHVASDGGGLYYRSGWSTDYRPWVEIWDSGNDGAGSGLDADLLDGLDLHTGRNNEANKVVRTDVNGYIQAGWINTTSGATTATIDRIYASNDGYIRYVTPATLVSQLGLWTSGNDGSGSGLDADLLDGVQGANYLRSDATNANATFTDITLDDQIISSGDTDTYMQFHAADEWRVVTGAIVASGNVTAFSDERLKDNIETLDGSKVYESVAYHILKMAKPRQVLLLKRYRK